MKISNENIWQEDIFILLIDPYSVYALIDQNPMWIAQATFFDEFQTEDFKLDINKMGNPNYSWHVDNMEAYVKNRPDFTSVFKYHSAPLQLQELDKLRSQATMSGLIPAPIDHTRVHLPVLKRVK